MAVCVDVRPVASVGCSRPPPILRLFLFLFFSMCIPRADRFAAAFRRMWTRCRSATCGQG